MAGRLFDQVSFQLEKNPVRLYAQVTFGAAGAPTLVAANSKGFASVTKTGTGTYVLVLGQNRPGSVPALDTYFKILQTNLLMDATQNSGTAPAAPLAVLTANAVSTAGSASFTIETTNLSQVATNPASGEQLFIEIELSNGSGQ